jgi:hypothetical protein
MKAYAGKRYRHYKGREYTVLTIGRLESSPEQECVIYRAEYDTEFGSGIVWVRPKEDFEGDVVKDDGTRTHRFTVIENA